MTGNRYKLGIKLLIDFLFRHNVRYMYYFRKYSESRNLIYKYAMYRCSRKYGLEISSECKIGTGLYLGHPYNITVGGNAEIGDNCNLHKGCTIGRINTGKRAGIPKIGNNVWIGINAVIVGGITIGDDVVIAPGSFVNFDVPSHSVVIGNPGSIHYKENATHGYI